MGEYTRDVSNSSKVTYISQGFARRIRDGKKEFVKIYISINIYSPDCRATNQDTKIRRQIDNREGSVLVFYRVRHTKKSCSNNGTCELRSTPEVKKMLQ